MNSWYMTFYWWLMCERAYLVPSVYWLPRVFDTGRQHGNPTPTASDQHVRAAAHGTCRHQRRLRHSLRRLLGQRQRRRHLVRVERHRGHHIEAGQPVTIVRPLQTRSAGTLCYLQTR